MESLSAVDFAEKYDYPRLIQAVQLQPFLAQEVDDFGMMPLHWICSDPRVPLRVIQKIVLVHPSATATKNLAGLLPLHIALRKNLPLEALKLLLKFYPKAITIPTPDRRTPLELADERVTSPATKMFLQMLEAEVRALSRVATTSKKQQKKMQLEEISASPSPVASPIPCSSRGFTFGNDSFKDKEGNSSYYDCTSNQNDDAEASVASSHQYQDPLSALLNSPTIHGAAQQRPPIWKLSKRCHICECKFGYFRSRHHCRNCGESVCGRHSRDSLPLRHLGMFDPQRVCAVCHESLQNTFAGCNTNEHSRRNSIVSNGSSVNPIDSPQTVHDPTERRSRNHSLPFEVFPSFPFSSSSSTAAPMSSKVFKRSKSVRNCLTATPRANGRMHNYTLDTATTASYGTMSPVMLSPARSVSSDAMRRNYSYASLSHLPLFPSASSMFLGSMQVSPETNSSSSNNNSSKSKSKRQQRTTKKPTVQQGVDDEEQSTTHSSRSHPSSRRRQRLVKTELDSPSKAWYEELDQLPGEDSTNQKLSMDSRVEALEEHVQKLLLAKRQIGDELKHSQMEIHLARAEKKKYDAIAQKYLDHGYAPCSPSRKETDPIMGELDDEADGDDGARGFITVMKPPPPEIEEEEEEEEGEVTERSTDESDLADASSMVRPSSPLPVPKLSPFRSEKLELHIPLDIAATHHDLGVVLLSKCDFSSAASAFEKSLAINGDNAIAWYHLAKALDGKGDLDDAEKAVRRALELDAESLPSLSLLGRLLHLRGEHDAAIVVFRQALKLQTPI